MRKGKFIVIDGGEGVGKTTLVKNLTETYRDNIIYIREPGGSIFAEKLRELILSDDAENLSNEARFMLFWASRIDFMERTLKPALSKYDIVVSDRFDSSTYAYQVFVSGDKELENLFWQTRNIVLKDIAPDMYIILDVDPKISLGRIEARNGSNYFDKKDLGFHNKVRDGFLSFVQKLKNNGFVVDASRSEQVVQEEVEKTISLRRRLEFDMDLL